jgi:hypothetical protein
MPDSNFVRIDQQIAIIISFKEKLTHAHYLTVTSASVKLGQQVTYMYDSSYVVN